MASTKNKVTFQANPVNFVAAAEGDTKSVPRFEVVAYTGVPMYLAGFELPVVVDLEGMQFAKNIVANLDHEQRERVGHVTEKEIADGQVKLSGLASAATAAKKEVVDSAKDGFVWEASIEAYLESIDEIDAGETVEVNGREVAGPVMVARKSKLVGFGFVPHGADDNTSAKIAASKTAQKKVSKEKTMDKELRAFIEAMLPGIDVDSLSADAVANLKADFEGKGGKRKIAAAKVDDNPFTARKAERDRRQAIREIADKFCEMRPNDIEAIEKCHDHAIEAGMSTQEFRLELYESGLPESYGPIRPKDRNNNLTDKVVEAAICMTGRLDNIDKAFDERTLDMAHSNFKGGIGLKQLWCLAAEANGYKPNGYNVDLNVHRAAFGMHQPGRYAQAFGFTTISLPNILSNVANKFIQMGWNFVDRTPLDVASIRSVNDFKTITTVSLTADSRFAQLAPDGEIPHGELGEVVYTNKADTYGRMYAITRTDIINDDVGALTQVPRKLGRGAMLLLNHIFWTEFLNNGSFFTSGNANVNTGVADMTTGGLAATETIFMNQTDPDGNPLGAMPAILLVPTALKAAALTLMSSEKLIDGTATAVQGDANIWRGRFRVLSSPYMSNTSYTGNSAVAWYMLADPNDIPVIEIAALNGRVEPTVETADAPFNFLGVQMRGFSDIGVNLQEARGGVRADGGSS